MDELVKKFKNYIKNNHKLSYDELEEKIQEILTYKYNFDIEQQRKKKQCDLLSADIKKLLIEINKLTINYFCLEHNTCDFEERKKLVKAISESKPGHNICLMDIKLNELNVIFIFYDKEWHAEVIGKCFNDGIEILGGIDKVMHYKFTNENCRSVMEKITQSHFTYLRSKGMLKDEEEDDLGEMYETAGIEW